MNKNPFLNRRSVYGDDFYSRTSDLAYILNFILAENPQSVSIVSRERMGASSLLHHICKVVGPAKKPDALFIYVDMQSIQSRKNYFHYILKELGEHGDDHEAMGDALYRRKKQHIIVFLDHFDKVLSKPEEFDVDFFDYMRSLISGDYHLAFVLVTSEPLAQLNLPHTPGGASPLKNIYQTQCVLKHWSIPEQRAFIHRGFGKAGMTISEEEIDFIVQNAKKSPFYLVVLLDHYYRAKVRKDINPKKILKDYQDDIKGVSGSKPKQRNGWIESHLWQIIFSLISVVALLLWGIFGLPRASAAYRCQNASVENFSVLFDYPQYLSIGDVGLVNTTIKNDGEVLIAPVVVVINFTEPVQMLSEYSNRIEYDNLDSGEQRATELKFRLANTTELKMSAQLMLDSQIVQCEPITPNQFAQILPGPVPYLMTFWIWLGTTGPIGWLAPLLIEWLKRKGW